MNDATLDAMMHKPANVLSDAELDIEAADRLAMKLASERTERHGGFPIQGRPPEEKEQQTKKNRRRRKKTLEAQKK